MKLLMKSGKLIDVFNYTKDDFNATDVVHGLSNIMRFSGQSATPYSVATHSMNVENVCRILGANIPTRFFALLHDAAEVYIGDIPAPVKAKLPEVVKVEKHINNEILRFFIEEFKFADIASHVDWQLIDDVDKSIVFQELQKLVISNPIELTFNVKYVIPAKYIQTTTERNNDTVNLFIEKYNTLRSDCIHYFKNQTDKIEEVPF